MTNSNRKPTPAILAAAAAVSLFAGTAAAHMTDGGEDLEPISIAGPTALTALGGGLTLGGVILASAPDVPGQPLWRGHPTRIALTANLLTTGIPTFVTGLVLAGKGSSEVADVRYLGAWQRAKAAKVLHLPYLLTGMVMTSAWLTVAVHGGNARWIADDRVFLLPVAGVATLVTGLALAASGDQASAELYGHEPGWDDEPGRLLLKSGVAFVAAGGATVALGGLTFMPLELSLGGDGAFSSRVMLTGLPFLIAGVPMLLAGIQRCQIAERQHPGVSRVDHPQPRLLGVAPIHDPRTKTVGLSAAWSF